jgi:hypothetical protein
MAQINGYNAAQTVTGTALSDGLEIDASTFKDERTVLVFDVTTTDAGATMTIAAGAYEDATLGSIEVPVTVGIHVVVLETARFKNADNNVVIDIDSIGSLAGTVLPLQLP